MQKARHLVPDQRERVKLYSYVVIYLELNLYNVSMRVKSFITTIDAHYYLNVTYLLSETIPQSF